MNPSFTLRAAVAALFLLCSVVVAEAATTEFRVYLDTDHDATTGCTVGGMSGVEQLLFTEVTDSGTTANVTATLRQLCMGSTFGPLTDGAGGWPAGWNAATRELTFETRIAFSALGSEGMPRDIRVGFEARRGGAVHTALENIDGDDVLVPAPPRRRRGTTPGGPRVIVMDGALADWGAIPSSIYGIASEGATTLRLLRVFAFANPNDRFLYFAAIARLGSNDPFADDDLYSRRKGENLSVAGPGVLANDGDPFSQPLSAVQVTEPERGSVILNADGSFTYAPDNPQVMMPDAFDYKASAGTRESNVARVLIRVNDGTNTEPEVIDATFTIPEGSPNGTVVGTVEVTDDPADTHTFAITGGNTFGAFAIDPATGVITVANSDVLLFDFNPTFTLTVQVTDNGLPALSASGTITINLTCESITVTNPAVTTATTGVFFSQNFTETGAVGGATFTTTSTLPAGLTLATNGTLSGTPTEPGTFPIIVTVNQSSACSGTGATYNLVVNCQSIVVTNPANSSGTASSPFSETFTQAGGNGPTTFSIASGTLPAGLTLAANGVLSGTPTQTGSFPIRVRATDENGCTGTGPTYTLVIACQTITVTNPANGNGTASSPFSETFLQSGGIGTTSFSIASGTLPAGLTLAASGVLSGTPTQTGSFPITVTATDSNGCTGTSGTYTIVIGCQTINVTNPANTAGTVSAPFSETFTETGAIGTATFTTASPLPAGLTLSTAGVLSGTPTVNGTFPIVVTVTDSNGCTGMGATYTLVIGCQTITVTNPANASGTVSTGFSETFTQTAAVGGATFTLNSGVLPAGLNLATNGTLSGTPLEDGSFPITVLVTDGNGCTGTSATYTLVIACQTITVTNPANATGPAGSVFSETFTESGSVGGATFTTASTLPTGITLSTAGVLSGTPTQNGTFPIVVTVTDGNGCTGTSATYNLIITCQTITVTNPVNANGTANSAFSETFTESGSIGGATFTTSSTLPAGLTLATNGVLSGTPTQTGAFPIVVTVTDGNGCTGTSATYNLVIACQTITVTNPTNGNGTAASPFSETFTETGAIGTATFTLTSGTLPAGLTLAANGVLSGTPTQTGSFPITVTATDSNGCTGTGGTYTIIIGCQTITVTNPTNTAGTVGAAFSETFTQTGAIGTATFTTASTLPAGLTLSTAGVLSGTPTEDGGFAIVVTVTDSNGCTGTSATYNLSIGCQTITVTNPANASGTVSAGFSETFTQADAVGGATFTLNSGVLPAGLTLATDGTLSGTPLEDGSFPITVLVTDGNGCTGVGPTYTLVIACQTITVSNPANDTGPAGTPFSETFTESGSVGGATFTTASTLPTGLTLSTAGVLSGTPTQGGTFPIVVTVTDGNGCTGVGATYNLVITCPTITVTNPGNSTGTSGVAFSETFSQSGGIGTITWSVNGTLPSGISINPSTGELSGTTNDAGVFAITVTATDQNGCQGTGATYNLTINCQTITVTNPGNSTGTVDAAFSETFTQTGVLGTVTWSVTGTLPGGITIDSSTGVLSGTPEEDGSFPVTVRATDTNGCFDDSAYTLTINCQIITVTNPGVNSGTVNAAFSQTFTQTGAHGTVTWSIETGTPPAGITINSATGELSGTPTEDGVFALTIRATDVNGCFDDSAYTLTINCQVITVTNPANATGTVGSAFSEQFTQSAAHGTATFSTLSTLPAGFSLDSTTGILSGTTNQFGNFPIVVTVTDANGCTGDSPTYNLVINCQTITVTSPTNTNGTVNAAFSEQFTQTGALGGATFSTASTLPAGITLSTAGLLDGTPTEDGLFAIVVVVTDGNGCTGTSATYNLNIACQTITVTNPVNATGTAGSAFSELFTQTGAVGTVTWSTSGTLPSGISINTSTGELSGVTSQTGNFPITVTATDQNGCQGTGSTYTLIINCQTITVTNPTPVSVQSGVATDATYTFTATGILGTASWSVTGGTLPTGITLNATSGQLEGSSTQVGSHSVTVRVTDTNGCFDESSYTLEITCPTITVTRSGGGSFPNGTYNVAYSGESFTASGGTSPYTFAVTAGTFPAGLTLNSDGTITGTPTATGVFNFTVEATDAGTCTGSQAFTINIAPDAQPDGYGTSVGTEAVGNTQVVVDGHSAPATPFVAYTGAIVANDQPAGVTVTTVTAAATTLGGLITIDADGKFTYTPPVGVVGDDTYTYTITSNGVSNTAVITIRTANVLWYVNNTYAGANGASNGQSHRPFTTSTAAAAAAQINQTIFVHTGVGVTTGAFAMKSGQILHGNGLAFTLRGLSIPAGSNPTLDSTVTLESNTVVRGLAISNASGSGIAGSVNLGISSVANVALTGAGGLALTSGAAGTLNVTSTSINTSGAFNALRVDGTTATVTIDSASTVTGGGGTPVLLQNNTAGTVTFGAVCNCTGQTAGQHAIRISNNSGTWGVSFTNAISGAANSGSGAAGILRINNNSNSGGISFTHSNNGLAAGGSAFGVDLDTNTGATISFTGGGLQVGTQTGVPFNAVGGGTVVVTGTNNTITTSGATTAVNIANTTIGGSGITFRSVAQNGGTNGIVLNNVGAGAFTVAGTGTSGTGGTIQNTTGAAISLTSTGTVNLSHVTVSGTTATGLTGSSFGTLNLLNLNVSAVTGLSLTNGTVNNNGGSAFNSLNSTGGTNGVSLTNVAGAFTITSGALSGATGATFLVSGGTVNVTMSASITQGTAGQPAVSITGGHNAPINFNGNVTATSGTGLQFNNADGIYNVNATTSLNGGDAGIDVIGGSTGTFTFASTTTIGNTSSPSGIAFNIDNGSAQTTVTYNGTINTTLNRPVSIQNVGANSVISFTGNVTSTSNGILLATMGNPASVTFSGASKSLSVGTNTAVSYTGAAGNTVTFSNGGLVITRTTGAGIVATTGGTLIVTRNAGTANIINSGTSGTALSLNGVTIGTGGLVFQSISQNGGANGIFLQNTGSTAGLTIAGNSGAGTGGTIQSTTGADLSTNGVGIYLNNTRNVSLSFMQLNGHQNYAIRGLSVVNFDFLSSVINGTNGNSAATDPNEASIRFTDLTGTANVTNSSIGGGHVDNLAVINNSGTLNRITITGNTFGTNSNEGNDAVLLQADTTATIRATVNNNIFTSSRGDQFQFSVRTNGTNDLVFQNNTLTNNHPSIVSGGGCFSITSSLASPTLAFNITGNTIRDCVGSALIIGNDGTSSGNFSGTIAGNTIGDAGAATNGSTQGSGIVIGMIGTGGAANTSVTNVNITNNQIYDFTNYGILTQLELGGNLISVVQGNTIAQPHPNAATTLFPTSGIRMVYGTNSLGGGYKGCLTIGHLTTGALKNTLTGTGTNGGQDIRVFPRFTSVVGMLGSAAYPGATGATATDSTNWLTATNVLTTASGLRGNTATYQATCP